MNLQFFRSTLRKMLRERKLTLNALSVQADLSEDTLRSIIYGKSQDIKLSTMIKIADVLNCSLDELAGRSPYSKQEQSIISRMRNLPKRSTNILQFMIELEEHTLLHKSSKKTDIVPVFIPTGNLRDGMYYDNSTFEDLDISEYPRDLKILIDFGIRIITHGYEPVYYPNDILLFSHSKLPEYHDIVLYVDNSGKIYIRKYLEYGLEAINGFGGNISSSELKNYTALGVALKVAKEFDIEQYR